jgi:GNAT superfamily N-acetyltransferase
MTLQLTEGRFSNEAAGGLCGFPGRLWLAEGAWADYRQLAGFHYRGGHPAGPCGVVGVWHDIGGRDTLAGVAVLARPTLRSASRERVLAVPAEPVARARWVNERVRTIARVIVHPTYRSLGIGTWLVKGAAGMAARQSRVRYVEAFARMGRVHPLFAAAGMKEVPTEAGRPAYYYLELG